MTQRNTADSGGSAAIRVPFTDPPLWPHDATCADKVSLLAAIDPEKIQALHVLIDAVLRESWWRMARTGDGLTTLARLREDL